MQEERPETPLIASEAVSWWSWRPGSKPVLAFLLGGLLTLLGLFLLLNGLVSLVAGLLDSSEAPLQVSGIVTGHSKDLLGSPQLTIQLKQTGLPPTVSLTVSPTTFSTLNNGVAVTIDYGPHLHTPYALVTSDHKYPLPGTSPSGNLLETLALLAFGLVLLPYPALLFYWSWRDLRADRSLQTTASVVALRTARQTTTRTPGLVPRTTGTWYGIALQIDTPLKAEILIFGVQQDLHNRLHVGDRVQASYSPYLHHLYTLKPLEKSAL